jgi:hypothetical protein
MCNPMRRLMSALTLSLAWLVANASTAWAEGLTLYVAPNGNDAWSGGLAEPKDGNGPFLTLQRARDEIRKLKRDGGLPKDGIGVEIRGGVYELASPLALTAEDSGTADAPIVYRGRKGDKVRLVGGRIITGWGPVTDPAVLARLEESARGQVVQADLKAQGITDLGEVKPGPSWGQSEAGLELFFQHTPMTLARWPNEGFVKIPKVVGPTLVDCRGTKGCQEGIFTYEGDRPRRWIGEPEIMLEGYWFWDWADQRLKVESIDLEKSVISLMPQPQHAFGFRDGQWYYAYNLLSELDRPGEWYLDRDRGILYFWPPAPVEQGQPTLSMLPSLVVMKDVSNVTLSGLLLEVCRDTALVVENAAHVQIVGCTLRNAGGFAISLSGCNSSVVGCDIYDMGNGGVILNGGDRNTLAPGELVADNNHIHHYGRINRMCKAAISLGGVGNRATHNLIDNAPHQAMNFSGNDHLIEFNEIHSVCYESNDAGAIYSGRNWTMRGTVIRHNFFHDISGYEGRGCVGVYLDDQFCGTEIIGNLFHKVTRAAMIGGGRDCTIANNIFVDCLPATHVDARGLGWAADGFDGLKKGLDDVPYQAPLWAGRYPKLVPILDEQPMAPKGNLIARNICVGGRWGDFYHDCMPMVTFQDNLLDQDPQFVDAEHGNFQLKDDSPAFKLGFQRLPLEKIGLYPSPERASWPVEHTVRPVAAAAK